MKMKYSLQQIYNVISAVLFLIGAIFMLVNTFTPDQGWSLWVGLGFAIVATVMYVLLLLENRKATIKKLEEPNQ